MSLKPMDPFASNFVGWECSLEGPLPSLLKSGWYPYFSWNYAMGIFLCNFMSILKGSFLLKSFIRHV